MKLADRLAGVVRILEASNAELQIDAADDTGFVPVLPDLLAEAVIALMSRVDTSRVSLDLGCGNGGWLLLAAAAGYPSYGVEINPLLVEHAKANYARALEEGFIDQSTPCEIITADMIPHSYRDEYDLFRKEHPENERSMPQGDEHYDQLPVTIASADVVYCWAWPTQSRFIFNMLEREAKKDAIFILPCFARYTQGEHMNAMLKERNTLFLQELFHIKDVFCGKRLDKMD